ncbi:hypothetical protein GTP46_08295 [Duganella sp. FT135W]|uniref:Uncharacterized protein n=1 Tax=Duganella flavida TaxID=2692175 RepID=A0A6L8K9Y9_9BURK|nr:hypothetical protein [Duganella flavida]MYM22644.1 hypothetical protein [Duganella flavida]
MNIDKFKQHIAIDHPIAIVRALVSAGVNLAFSPTWITPRLFTDVPQVFCDEANLALKTPDERRKGAGRSLYPAIQAGTA